MLGVRTAACVKPVNLQDLQGCLQELQSAANGLAELDHWLYKVVDLKADSEEAWKNTEAEILENVRGDLPKTATAGEVKAAVTREVNKTPRYRKVYDQWVYAKNVYIKVEAYTKSLTSRGSFAQSAQKIHDQIARHGGDVNPPTKPPLRSVA